MQSYDSDGLKSRSQKYGRDSLERRGEPRRLINRVAQLRIGGALPRDCLVTDISASGVRLHVEGIQVPDEFVLILSGEDAPKECRYRVVWRLGHEIGAGFVALVLPSGGARPPATPD